MGLDFEALSGHKRSRSFLPPYGEFRESGRRPFRPAVKIPTLKDHAVFTFPNVADQVTEKRRNHPDAFGHFEDFVNLASLGDYLAEGRGALLFPMDGKPYLRLARLDPIKGVADKLAGEIAKVGDSASVGEPRKAQPVSKGNRRIDRSANGHASSLFEPS